ncbi:hypothetical protein CTEN210_09061 [Chaetoceros tenuissimus]|uniref:Protochlorophyllide reductase n=1 Tax=Chaetoceros tenuissimus TaxID=426638 RepID=A0AAD3CX65_9STRA|nr:hypothetical protein CTEN210_09061 [Chaetoceros tenuissimus]
MTSSIVLTAKQLRKNYLTKNLLDTARDKNLKAVVISASSGIGEACAHRLAEQGFTVIALGRDPTGERKDKILEKLMEKSKESFGTDVIPSHEFFAVDALSLADVDQVAKDIVKKHPVIDVLVMTQGMVSTSQRLTKDGEDEKLTLHYFSRVAMAHGLLPALQKSAELKRMQNGPVVMSILSGGVHAAYTDFQKDFSLRNYYSVKNAADAAGFYNDLAFDTLASQDANKGINFVHAAPGFINSTWGKEFNPVLRCFVRFMQPLGRSTSDCAEYMLGNTIFSSLNGDGIPAPSSQSNGLIAMGDKGQFTMKYSMNHARSTLHQEYQIKMDALPPNDPNRNNNNQNSHDRNAKEDPRGPRNTRGNGRNEQGDMEMFGGGNAGDEMMVAAIIFCGLASWLLREVCLC